MSIERPLASELREADAASLFPRDTSPDEYAARHAHEWAAFSFDQVRYRDTALDEWIVRLGDILSRRNGAPRLAELRARYLSAEERCRMEEAEQQDF